MAKEVLVPGSHIHGRTVIRWILELIQTTFLLRSLKPTVLVGHGAVMVVSVKKLSGTPGTHII